ncbi:DeoR family transcriptional regulator, partial [Streptomyces tricolor]
LLPEEFEACGRVAVDAAEGGRAGGAGAGPRAVPRAPARRPPPPGPFSAVVAGVPPQVRAA